MLELHVACCILPGQKVDLEAMVVMADSVSGHSGFTASRMHFSVPEGHEGLSDLTIFARRTQSNLRIVPACKPFGLRPVGESWVEHLGHVVADAPYGSWILAISPWEQVVTRKSSGLYQMVSRAHLSRFGAVNVQVGHLWTADSVRLDGYWAPREVPRLFRNDRRTAFSEVNDWDVLLPDMARINVPIILSGVRILDLETATLIGRRRKYDFVRDNYRYDLAPVALEELLDVSGVHLEPVSGVRPLISSADDAASQQELMVRAKRLLRPSLFQY